MIPYDLCLFPEQFCHIIVYIWKVKICVQAAERCAHLGIFLVVRRILLPSQMAARPRYTTSAQTAQNTPLPAFLLLLIDASIHTDRTENIIPLLRL
jgi:hypothetical protein